MIPSHWKQETFRQQYQVTLMALEGHIENLMNGIGDPKEFGKKIHWLLEDLHLFKEYISNEPIKK